MNVTIKNDLLFFTLDIYLFIIFLFWNYLIGFIESREMNRGIILKRKSQIT